MAYRRKRTTKKPVRRARRSFKRSRTASKRTSRRVGRSSGQSVRVIIEHVSPGHMPPSDLPAAAQSARLSRAKF